jgi:putative addiction module component (TIGR02574 family)
MSTAELLKAAKGLPIEDRVELTRKLRDDLEQDGYDLDLTTEQLDELERRAGEFRKNPEAAIPWEEARDKVRKQFGWT